MSEHLIVFLRNPVLGQVKTRLASDIGEENALKVYERLMAHTLEVCEHSGIKTTLYFDEAPHDAVQTPSNFHIREQRGKGLGERMTAAFEEVGSEDPKAAMIMIGSDCPEIGKKHLKDAGKHLQHCDLVIGPARDGGIYLIGLRNFDDRLFDGVPWSTSGVRDALVRNATSLKLTTLMLEEMSDVDHASDLEKCKDLFIENAELKDVIEGKA